MKQSPSQYRSVILITAALLLSLLFLWRSNHPAAFGTYWASGRAADHGTDPYTAYPLTGQSRAFRAGTVQAIRDLNLNPPLLLPVFQILSRLGLHGFAIAWSFISAACLATSIWLIMRFRPDLQSRQLLWLCLCAAVFDTILAGQIYFVLLLLSTLGLHELLSDREWSSAVAIGLLVALKPTTIFWPIFLLASGRTRPAIKSLAVATVASAIPLTIYGISVYESWLNALSGDMHWIEPTDIALPAFLARAGVPFGVGLAIALTAAAWGVVAMRIFRPSIVSTTGLGLCVAILCSPLAWAPYAIMLAPAFTAYRWRTPRPNIAASLLAIPGPAFILLFHRTEVAMLAAGFTYLVGVLLIAAYFAKQQRVTGASADEYISSAATSSAG